MNAVCCRPNRAVVVASPLEHMIEQFFTDSFPASARAGEGNLPLDVSESDTHVIVRASLPGFTREDVDVEVHDGLLTIRATRPDQSEPSGERYTRRERRVTGLARRIPLPADVRDKDAQADLRDGVLTLKLPKSEQAQPRKIRVG